jgi:serine/threonine protein kinase
MFGKIIYYGKWKSKSADRIIIVEMNEAIAEREAFFYLEVNSHKNIIQRLGYIENCLNLTIFIQDYAEHNDLGSVLMDNQFNITQPILKEMFLQIADAMTYVASKGIVHGDLGCRNVLVFRVDSSHPRNNLVKLTDFGLARWIDQPSAQEDLSVIPIRYCAPEILRANQHSSYSEKSDVYSMGVLIWEALSNSEIPYLSIAKNEDVERMKLDNVKPQRPSKCDRQQWVLMNGCWHGNPDKRPTFEEIKHKLLNIKISEVPHDQIPASAHK